jgi:hypothetical protein
MASRSSPSTRSSRTAMSKPSERSRAELPRSSRAAASNPQPRERGPAEKKHKNMAEVRATGRQSDQGDKPRSGKQRRGS